MWGEYREIGNRWGHVFVTGTRQTGHRGTFLPLTAKLHSAATRRKVGWAANQVNHVRSWPI